MLLLAATGLQAQVIIKHDGERVKLGNNKLVKMVFESYGTNNGDDIHFVCQAGDTLTFDIDDIRVIGFAEDFNRIDEVKQTGETAIVYDAATSTVYVVNAKEESSIQIFGADGKLAKSVKGTVAALPELKAGLYIVSYNQKLNAKIVKK